MYRAVMLRRNQQPLAKTLRRKEKQARTASISLRGFAALRLCERLLILIPFEFAMTAMGGGRANNRGCNVLRRFCHARGAPCGFHPVRLANIPAQQVVDDRTDTGATLLR